MEIAELLNIHEKTWAKIENGITRLDLERLHQIAKIFEIPIEDLINAEDSVYISEIKENKVGFNNSQVTIHDGSEVENQLYEKLLAEKDRALELQAKYIAELEQKLNQTS